MSNLANLAATQHNKQASAAAYIPGPTYSSVLAGGGASMSPFSASSHHPALNYPSNSQHYPPLGVNLQPNMNMDYSTASQGGFYSSNSIATSPGAGGRAIHRYTLSQSGHYSTNAFGPPPMSSNPQRDSRMSAPSTTFYSNFGDSGEMRVRGDLNPNAQQTQPISLLLQHGMLVLFLSQHAHISLLTLTHATGTMSKNYPPLISSLSLLFHLCLSTSLIRLALPLCSAFWQCSVFCNNNETKGRGEQQEEEEERQLLQAHRQHQMQLTDHKMLRHGSSENGDIHGDDGLVTIGGEGEWNGLDLRKMGIASISQTISFFSHLTCLFLNDNKLTSLPEGLFSLTKLTRLDISNNMLTKLPGQIGQLLQLVELNASNNRLRELPCETGRLFRLKILQLDGNAIVSPSQNVMKQSTEAITAYLREKLEG